MTSQPPTDPAPKLIQSAVPLVELDLRLVSFDELPPELAAALRELNARVYEVFEIEPPARP